MVYESSIREPADVSPHHLGEGVFEFKRDEVAYLLKCTEITVKWLEAGTCYLGIPSTIRSSKTKQYLKATMHATLCQGNLRDERQDQDRTDIKDNPSASCRT